uniref:Uncharacterized protein n=1 Tax=Chloropicon laureae TaxID=464258 RepID=A0A7S2Z6I9_9CHLO|mmetsp:Transcript_7734/g.19843  ORF Transcript_7734/g.19843 Transcript_7734/m.19843 type:complete len:797 (+) Transcript_7734:129-2519(+)
MGSIARCSLWWAVAVALCALLVAASPAWGAKAAAGAGQKADDDAIAATVDLSDLIDSLLLPRLAAPRGRQSATFKTRALLEAEAEAEEEAGIEEADEEEEIEGGDEELLVDGEDTDDDTESLDEVDDNLEDDLNELDSSDPLGEGTTMNNDAGIQATIGDESQMDYQRDTSSGPRRRRRREEQEEASGIAEGMAAAVTDDDEETMSGPMMVEEPVIEDVENADPGDVVPPPAMEADNSMVGWGEQFDQLEEEAAAFSEDEEEEIDDALEEIADGLEDEDGPVDVVLAFNADAIGSGENGQDGLTAAMPDGQDGEDAVVAIAVNGNAEAVGGDGGNGRDGADGLDGALSVDGDNIQSNGMNGEDGGNGGQGGQGGYALAIGVDVDAAAGGGDGGNGGEPSACPERLPQALHLCVEKLRELRASDRAMYGKENEARITVFLSSPPRGMAAFAEELQELKEALDALDAEVHFILHPDAYSPRFHAPMKDDKTLWDMTGCRSPYSQPRARALCSDEDMEALQDVTYEKFSWQVHMADFLSTLLDYRSHYFGQAFDIVETLLPRWEACYGNDDAAPLLVPPYCIGADSENEEELANMIVKVRLKEGASMQEFRDFFFSQSHQRTIACDESATLFATTTFAQMEEREAVIMFSNVQEALLLRRIKDIRDKSLERFIASVQVYRSAFVTERGRENEFEHLQPLEGFDDESTESEGLGIFLRILLREGVNADEWLQANKQTDEDRKTCCNDAKTVIAKINDHETCVMLADVDVDRLNELYEKWYDLGRTVVDTHIVHQFAAISI